MKRRFPSILFLPAMMLFWAFASGAEISVEPYSSQPTAGEMAFVAQWKQFLLGQGDAAPGVTSLTSPSRSDAASEAAENGSQSKRRASSRVIGRMTRLARIF